MSDVSVRTGRRRAAAAGLLVAFVAACSTPGNSTGAGSSPSVSNPSASASNPSASSTSEPSTTASSAPASASGGGAAGSTSPSGSPASGPSAGPGPELARFYDQKPTWNKCDGAFQCTKVTVPRSYAEPQGDTIELAVIRLEASGPDRKGSLLINPGGPGASGVAYAKSAEFVISEPVRKRFDVVGFDPRGVGKSNPIDCLTDPQTDRFIAADGSPDDAAEEQELVHQADLLATGCQKKSGPLLGHLSTKDAARDMDVLRGVLGDERLHYLGKSYGTYLGATYAELFPDRVGEMVLDGALDPTSTAGEVSLEQAKGFDQALGAFVDDCLPRQDCPLKKPHDAALAQIGTLLERIDRTPLRTAENRPVPQAVATLGIATALYDQGSGWPNLRQALREAFDGSGDSLLLLSDAYTEREDNGHYASNSNEVIYAVNCLDRRPDADLARIREQADRFAKEAPIFGRYLAWSDLPCSTWPLPAANTPHAITAPGARPIVVVGTTRDPATPYKWAVSLAEQLESGVLLSWNGDGHTAYRRGSACIDAAVDAYLLRGEVPADGKRCD